MLKEMQDLFSRDYFATEQCGIHIDQVSDGEAYLSMPIQKHHLNANGVVQGGAIFTLCDTAFAVAANAGESKVVNRSSEITYLKPGTGSVLTAHAETIARGATMGLYKVSVFDQDHALIAYMTSNGYCVKR